VNGAIGAFEAREENEARMDGVPFLMTPKSYYLLITFFFFLLNFFSKVSIFWNILERNILGYFVIKCLDEVLA
jgi:hypothetical protein